MLLDPEQSLLPVEAASVLVFSLQLKVAIEGKGPKAMAVNVQILKNILIVDWPWSNNELTA